MTKKLVWTPRRMRHSQLTPETKLTQHEWGLLLINAKNAFNEGNWMKMLWTIQHKWPSGAHFMFNCYKHWGTLPVPVVLRGKHNLKHGVFLHSKESVTQGEPLSMFAYGLGILPIIHKLKAGSN
jgi:hypothetical protein